MMPPPVTTESTSAMAATAIAGTMAKRHGLLLAPRMARLGWARHRAPAAATTKKATAPMARDPLRALRWNPDKPEPRTCKEKSPAATTPPVATQAPQGRQEMTAPRGGKGPYPCEWVANFRSPALPAPREFPLLSRFCRRLPRSGAWYV